MVVALPAHLTKIAGALLHRRNQGMDIAPPAHLMKHPGAPLHRRNHNTDEAPPVRQMMIGIFMTVGQTMKIATLSPKTVQTMVVAPPAHLTKIPGAPLHRRNQIMDEAPPVHQMSIVTCMTVRQKMDIAARALQTVSIMVVAPAHLTKIPGVPLHRRNQSMDEA